VRKLLDRFNVWLDEFNCRRNKHAHKEIDNGLSRCSLCNKYKSGGIIDNVGNEMFLFGDGSMIGKAFKKRTKNPTYTYEEKNEIHIQR